jgi:heat shock transcription factor
MLSMIANTTGAANANNLATAGANALTNPQPPPMPQVSDIVQSQEQLELLQRLQDEQAQKVQSLADRLGPLSPSGTVPGIHDDSIPPSVPDNFNIDDWFNDPSAANFEFDPNHDTSNFDFSYFDNPNTSHGTDFSTNNNFGANNDELFTTSNPVQNAGGRVESVSSRASTPSRAVDDTGSPARKRKRNS